MNEESFENNLKALILKVLQLRAIDKRDSYFCLCAAAIFFCYVENKYKKVETQFFSLFASAVLIWLTTLSFGSH